MDNELKVNNFDLLRLLAATQVVVGHSVVHFGIAPSWWWPWVEAFPGVPIFFALSGFLISASFERNSNLLSYGRNRLLRIYPGLWCCVLVTVGVAVACGYGFLSGKGLLWLGSQLVGLIYTPQFLKTFGFGSYNGSLWTIPIELQFYFLLPLIYWVTGKSGRRTALIAIALLAFTIVAWLFARLSPPLAENVSEPLARKLFRYSFAPHVYLFLMGILLQRWQAHRSRWIAGKGLYWLAAFLAFHFFGPGEASNYVLGTLLMGVMAVSMAYTAPRLSQRLLRGNDISYGVYLYHGLLINVLLELGYRGHVTHLLTVVGLTFVVGFLSWRFVERPFLRRKRRSIHAVNGVGNLPENSGALTS